jgi:hypothetical protein
MPKSDWRSLHRWVPLLLLGALACSPSKQVQQQLDSLTVAAAQKDSLLGEVADLAQFMSDVNSELAQVQLEGTEVIQATESPRQAERDTILGKIKVLNQKFDESETRLTETRRRIRSLSQVSDSLRSTLESTVANYERVLESQRTTIATLEGQLENLRTENVRLTATVDTLGTEVEELRTENNTVYYVIGTEDALLESGIIEKQGGSRVLFIFGKTGETLVPARDLDPAMFTPIDKWQVRDIVLPSAEKEYQIVSRQDVSQLATPPDEKGRVTGTLEILSPAEFWATSKYLIVVEK